MNIETIGIFFALSGFCTFLYGLAEGVRRMVGFAIDRVSVWYITRETMVRKVAQNELNICNLRNEVNEMYSAAKKNTLTVVS